MTQVITDETFPDKVLNSKGYTLVDFWAEWCGPCRQLSPIIDEISTEFENKVTVMKMNIDENPDSPSKLGVRSIPTLILFKDGKQIAIKVGSISKGALVQWLNSETEQATASR